MAKILAVALVALLAYGCAKSQLARSGIQPYDARPVAERAERRHVLRPETHAALRANAAQWQAIADDAKRREAAAP